MTPNAQLTHVGLYVEDMDAMVGFYTSLLGLVVTDSGEFLGRSLTFLSRCPDEHHQMVLIAGRDCPRDVQLLSQISFRIEGLPALRWFRDRALELGAAGMEARNHGNSWSLYFRDPEGNRLEIYTATPWYVSQPWRVPLDLDRADDEISEETRRLIQEGAVWRPVEDWRSELAARLGATGSGGG